MTNRKTHFIVQTAAANMPASCWGRYGKVAVLEVDAGLEFVHAITDRSRGCHQVVAVWDRLNIGSTDRCAFAIAEDEAYNYAAALNKQAERRHRINSRRRALRRERVIAKTNQAARCCMA